jgi:hypothetical protein
MILQARMGEVGERAMWRPGVRFAHRAYPEQSCALVVALSLNIKAGRRVNGVPGKSVISGRVGDVICAGAISLPSTAATLIRRKGVGCCDGGLLDSHPHLN